jgi:hypothetical protein
MNLFSYKNAGIRSNALGEFLEQIIQPKEISRCRKPSCDFKHFISLDYNIHRKLHF